MGSYDDDEFQTFTVAGKSGHLNAEPKFLDFDLVPIFDTKTKWFHITNNGPAPIVADLIVCHEQWLRDFAPELVTINPNSCSLVPHQSVLVSVTVRPSRANIQNFFIIYELAGIENYNDDNNSKRRSSSDASSATHLVDITFMGDHASFKATDIMLISRHPIWDAFQCWSMFSIDMLNQYLIPYSHTAGEGSLPEVPSVTFRFPPAPVDSESSIFQVLLSSLSDIKGYWELFLSPPKNWKKFLNNKKLSSKITYFDGHMKNNPDLLAYVWAEKFKLNDSNKGNACNYDGDSTKKESCAFDNMQQKEQNYSYRNVKLRKDDIFEISPISGSLNGKETQLITFKYNFKRAEYHKMTVLLRVYPAIFVWIDLSGRTLDIDQPYLQLMHKYHMKLHPISSADLDPPVQMFWLYNGGNVTASFTVDMDPFEVLKEENFGHSVIECLTSNGSVQPKSWFPIRLRFAPLEYTDYFVSLRIIPDFSDTVLEVTIAGSTAFNTAVCLRPTAPTAELRTFVIYDHAIPISLTPAHITIRHFIPTGHKATSCVFLTNLHTQNYMSFRWPEVSIEGGGSIRFQPNCGRIPPREEVSCLVIIEAGKVSATFSSMVRCMIEDENEKVIYEFVLEQWKKEQEKAQLIDSEKCKKSSNKSRPKEEIGPIPVPPQPFSRLLAISVYIGSVFGLYDTIAPKEISRMSHPETISVSRPIPTNVDVSSGLILSKFERRMSEEIISSLLWDIIQGPGYEYFVRQATKRQAPLYDQYKSSEQERERNGVQEDENPKLAVRSMEEIIEAVVFNLIQEMSTNYVDPSTREKWHELPPVQPKAFVDVEKYNNYL